MSSHPALLDRARCALLVVDMQEAFRYYIDDFAVIAREIHLLRAGAERLGVPAVCSEQYPTGLGATAPEVGTGLEPVHTFAKLEFAACDTDEWRALPTAIRDAEQFVIVGLETHVCVRQTALALLADGRDVHVPVDAVASHTSLHRDTALTELARAGVHLTTVEQVLFDWLGAAGTPEFKDVQLLLKRHLS